MPLVVPTASRAFDADGEIQDVNVELQLHTLGAEVARVAQRFATDHSLHRQSECDEAAARAAAVA